MRPVLRSCLLGLSHEANCDLASSALRALGVSGQAEAIERLVEAVLQARAVGSFARRGWLARRAAMPLNPCGPPHWAAMSGRPPRPFSRWANLELGEAATALIDIARLPAAAREVYRGARCHTSARQCRRWAPDCFTCELDVRRAIVEVLSGIGQAGAIDALAGRAERPRTAVRQLRFPRLLTCEKRLARQLQPGRAKANSDAPRREHSPTGDRIHYFARPDSRTRGIFFDADKRELLADKLSTRVVERGFDTFLDYYYLLKYGPGGDLEWPHVLDALSVQETYFWREVDQIHALAQDILPAFVVACPGQPAQIWCAACATGEEPLTIAMVLCEAGWFDRLPVRILASDASPAAIAKARRGIYRERSFRSIPKALQDKYFTAATGGWQVSCELSSRVEYSNANLMRPDEIEPLASRPLSSAGTCSSTFRRTPFRGQ